MNTEMQREVREDHVGKMAETDVKKFTDTFNNNKLVPPERPGEVMAGLVLDPDRSLNGQYVKYVDNFWQ